MLKHTKSPKELIKEELDEEVLVLTQEEKIKNVILMFQVIALDRMNLHPLYNVSTLFLAVITISNPFVTPSNPITSRP